MSKSNILDQERGLSAGIFPSKLKPVLYLQNDQPEIRGLLLVGPDGRVYKKDAVTEELFEPAGVKYPLSVHPYATEGRATAALMQIEYKGLDEPAPKPINLEGPNCERRSV